MPARRKDRSIPSLSKRSLGGIPARELLHVIDPAAWARDELKLELDDWQRTYLLSRSKRKALNCCRQSGKSTVASVKALHRVIHKRNSLVLLLSPSLRQSSELFRKVSDLYNSLPARPKLVEDNRLSMALSNGSRIVSLPSSEATIRGYSCVDLIIEDESAAVPDELHEACEPMLAVSNGEYDLLSTPRGQHGHFYKAMLDASVERFTITAEQVPRISKEYLDAYRLKHGQRVFAQEFGCEFLGDRLGSLWKRAVIDEQRRPTAPKLVRVVVGVDPAVTGADDSDETGIVVDGIAADGHIYTLADRSVRGSPHAWALAAVQAYNEFQADRIVGEVNNGGDLVEVNIRTVGPKVAYKAVHASRGKLIRAEPVAALYEQGKVHHVGFMPELEDQMCEWVPGESSPDRMDAHVWAVTELALQEAAAGPDPDRWSSYSGRIR
jgi:phage terminase large subunit-like protein